MNILFSLLLSVASPAQTVAGDFVEILAHDDLRFLAQTVAEKEPEPGAWSELRDALQTYDCIIVPRAGWSIESQSDDVLSLRLDLNASGALKGAGRATRQLPRWWFVDARKTAAGWKIERAMTAERRLANAMAAAPAPADAARLFVSATDVDPAYALTLYAVVPSVDASIERLDAAIPLAQAIGDVSSELLMRRNRAHSLLAVNPPDAVAAVREAVELARARGTPDIVAAALLTAGYIEARANLVEDAARTFAAGAELAGRGEDPIPALKNLYMLGWLQTALGNQLQVLSATEKLAELSARYGWEEGEEYALFKRAMMHYDLGSLDVARSLYWDAIRLGESRGNRQQVWFSKQNLAGLEIMERNWDEAIALLRDLTEDPSLPNEVVFAASSRLLNALVGKKAFAEAEAVLRKAEKLIGTAYTTETELQRAVLQAHRSDVRLAEGKPEEAVEAARRSLAFENLPDRTDTRFVRFAAHRLLGQSLRAAGRPAEAVVALRNAVAIAEEELRERGEDPLSSAEYLEDNLLTYAELIDLLVEQKQVDEAFHVAEQMKGRALRETIERGRIDLSAAMSAEERAREQELEKRVEETNRAILKAPAAELSQQLAAARRELDAFRVEMRVKHPAMARRRIDTPDVRPAVSGSLAVIEYVVGEKSAIAFVLTGTSIEAVRLPVSRHEIEREAATVARLVAARSPRYRAPASKLYGVLVAPLEKLIAGRKTLCIIPDGALWTVPFHALPAGGDRALIDRHAVFYAHSLALLGNAQAERRAGAGLIAFGNPTVSERAETTLRSAFRDVAFGPLIEAEEEVRALARMYPPQQSRVYYRDAAKEGAFKRETPSFGVIHVAAHAFADDRSPMYSAIVLAANEAGEDGLLEAREVVDLPLNAELAVLSACETARGKVRHGEGVVGLSWAFAAAGCPTTLVSQWRAESKATAKLMIDFHRRLRAGDTTADALRAAQLALRKTAAYRHPFYWAPFVVVGAGDRVVSVSPAP